MPFVPFNPQAFLDEEIEKFQSRIILVTFLHAAYINPGVLRIIFYSFQVTFRKCCNFYTFQQLRRQNSTELKNWARKCLLSVHIYFSWMNFHWNHSTNTMRLLCLHTCITNKHKSHARERNWFNNVTTEILKFTYPYTEQW